jgi:hypothetical protein
MFLHWRGFNIDSGIFSISLCEPQNFASYRQSELDTSRISSFAAIEPLPYFSKRFLMKRYLGLSEEELVENETLWQEERDEPELETTQGQDLRSIGITPAGLESDIATGEEITGADAGGMPGGPEGGMPGAPTTAPGTAAPPTAGGVPGV